MRGKVHLPPTPEQAAAIDARDRDVFCEAGAGTGKTRVLVGRYCDALTGGEAEIDEILAFTFTERAAAELRQRIRAELSRRSAARKEEGDEAGAAELRGLARETERAWVTTIHGFCSRLLAAHPVAAGLDPRFRVLAGPESRRLRDRAAREAIQGLVNAGAAEVAEAAAAYRPWRLAEIALIAYERLRSQGMARPRLPEVGEPLRSGDSDSPLTPAERKAALASRAALDAVLAELDRRYEALKSARSGLDFSDLELRAVELLSTSAAIGELWRERFKHLMVDEFQDTNRVQLDLVEALRGPETRLFTVGDEHQSIYRFRNADLEVFRAERRAAGASTDTDLLALRGNFRSTPAILSVANQLGDVLLDGFEGLVPGAGTAEPGPDVELLLTLDEGKKKDALKWADHAAALEPPPSETIPRTVAQARALAERLRELVDTEGVAVGEIVVLLRAFTHVDAYEEALRRYGLEPYVVGGRGYWSQQQVEDLLRLLGVIANPLDDEMLFGALACPAAAISPDTLWLLRAAAGSSLPVWPTLDARFGVGGDFEPAEPARLEQIDGEEAEKLRRFCGRVAALRAEAPLLPLDSLVERTMNAFGYDLALLARPQPTGRMANVRKLMRLAAEFEQNEGRDLRAFLVQAAESTQRDEREGMAPVQAEAHDGVRIMTVHGAKGLEFPVVAVPELDRRLDVAHHSADVWIGRPDPGGAAPRFGLRLAFPTKESFGVWELTELDREERAAEAEESCRLVYVAATRAQRRLILSGAYKSGDLEATEPKTGDTVLSRFLPRLAELGWTGSDGPAGGGVPVSIRISAPSQERARELSPAPAAADWAAVGDGAQAEPPILDPERRAVPLGHLSYSALDAFKRCGYRFYVERVLGVDPQGAQGTDGSGAEDARALGTAVHAALEWSARAGWERPADERLKALLAREGAADGLERARRLVDGWLASPLCAEIGAAALRPEAPFALPLAGTILRGNIDLLARSDQGPVVVDFKTDAVGGDGVAPLGERYAAQRSIYALAVARTAPGAAVRAVHLFLERPADPVVEDFDPGALALARGRLEEVVERIRAAAFEPAAEPDEALCFGCPAAARLCPRPQWRPTRDDAAALR